MAAAGVGLGDGKLGWLQITQAVVEGAGWWQVSVATVDNCRRLHGDGPTTATCTSRQAKGQWMTG